MPNREVYKTMLQKNGISNRDRIITQTQRDIAENVISLPSYKKVLINETIEQFLQINSTDKDSRKRFTTMPTEIVKLGDIVAWKKMHWLVTQVDFDDEIVMRGEIEQCNREIKWQNPTTKEIISRWCFAERPYATGIDEGKIVSTPNREFRVKLPYDNETTQVDIGKRFVLETINGIQKTYKLDMTDLNTNKFQDSDGGFIVWSLKIDTNINPNTDNIELGICDYIKPDMPTPPPIEPTLLQCKITGRNTAKIGYSRNYKAIFYDAIGNKVDNIIPKWEIHYNLEHSQYYHLTETDNILDIKIDNYENLIGDIITINLSDNNGLYSQSEFKVSVVSAFG